MEDINSILKQEIMSNKINNKNTAIWLKYCGMKSFEKEPKTIARAHAFANLLSGHEKHIYHNDLIAGSIKGIYGDSHDKEHMNLAVDYLNNKGERRFLTNYDHAAPGYEKLVNLGVDGLVGQVEEALGNLKMEDIEYKEKHDFLKSVEIALMGFSNYIQEYAQKAELLMEDEKNVESKERLQRISDACKNISHHVPKNFFEALQLVWLAHTAFVLEGRFAMALGRIDQYLYPFFQRDFREGKISEEEAVMLFENVFLKIGEVRAFSNSDDVVNICIGGVNKDGCDSTNELSYAVLEAVKRCRMPGPNLSARFNKETNERFYLKCLEVIKTGIGYPALFNDEVVIPSLVRLGYSIEEARNHCFVGCIENYIPGKQPPWSDSRFNTPKYLELALNNGYSILTGEKIGLETGDAENFESFEKFLVALKLQIEFGAQKHVEWFMNENTKVNPAMDTAPFLSALFDDCISRGRDINNRGTVYPSNHGVACMGIGTMADSLSAVDEIVFKKKLITMKELVAALKADFKGRENVQHILISRAPKYGNDIDEVDRFGVWYAKFIGEVLDRYRTYDGGRFIALLAANVSNIYAGMEVGATPDGRNARMPLSDAASPTYGMDKNGPTSVLNSVSKPDYTWISGGSVVNQKFHPSVFDKPEGIIKIAALIRTYFRNRGPELQINIINRETLIDAMENPQHYTNLMVRVSGFSAYYVDLSDEVKIDILKRTEQIV